MFTRKYRFMNLLPNKLTSIIFIAFILISLQVVSGNAQSISSVSQQGGRPAGSYQLSDFDNVNLFNGNLNFNLPLLRVGGRGEASVSIPLTIERRWELGGGFDGQTPVYHYYSRVISGVMVNGPGNLIPQGEGYNWFEPSNCGTVEWQPSYAKLALNFMTADGTTYALHSTANNGAPVPVPGCYAYGGPGYNLGTEFIAWDGSGAKFVADSTVYGYSDGYIGSPYISGYLLLANGIRYRINNFGQTEWIQDRNGNRITFSYYSYGLDTQSPLKALSSITDSLGRTVSFQYRLNESPYGLHDKITYKGFDGTDRIIRISYNNFLSLLRSDFSLQSVPEFGELFPDAPTEQENEPVITGDMVSDLWLPDGRKYTFRYNQYGELARVVLPTGGAYEFDFAGDVPAPQPNQNPGPPYRRVSQRRVYADSTNLTQKTVFNWPQQLSSPEAGNTSVQVDVFDANNNLLSRSKHYFSGEGVPLMPGGVENIYGEPWQKGKEYKTESFASNGTSLLQKTETEWQARLSAIWNPYGNDPHTIYRQPVVVSVTTTLGDTGQVSKVVNEYNTETGYTSAEFNVLTDTYEYDWGQGTPGALLRRSHSTHGWSYVNQWAYIPILTTEMWVSSDSAGNNIVSRTQYEFDNYYPDSLHAALVDRSNIIGHDSSYNTNHGFRGNVTKVTRYANAANSTDPISVATQYDIAGNIVKAIDARGNDTEFYYEDCFGSPDGNVRLPSSNQCNNFAPQQLNGQKTYAFITSAINSLGHTGYSQFNYHTGSVVDSENAIGVVSSAFYDDILDRQTQIITANNYPALKRQVTIDYDDYNRKVTVTSDLNSFNDNKLKAESYYDKLGRTTESYSYEIGSGYIATKQTYDALSRVKESSNPYRPLLGQQPAMTTVTYDSLGRVKETETPDGAKVKRTYLGNQTTIEDQAGRKRRGFSDALGRTYRVIEDPEGPKNYQTDYTFDALGNIRKTVQGEQTRYFLYDSLSRLIRSRIPEQDVNTALNLVSDALTDNNNQWTQGFTYDANGNIQTKTDARGIITTFAYDALNRPTSKTYSNDPQNTPSVSFIYDNQALPTGAPTFDRGNSTGMLVAVIYGNGINGSYIGYDSIGRTARSRQITNDTPYDMTYSYDIAGNLISETYPSGRVVTNSFDDAGRLKSVTSQELNQPVKTYASNFSYNSQGLLERVRLGNSRWESYQYNNRLQVTQVGLGASIGDTSFLKIDYDYGTAASNNSSLKQQIITLPGLPQLKQQYEYDELNRLKLTKETNNNWTSTQWQQVFNYDRYGNRTINTSLTFGQDSTHTTQLVGQNPDISTARNRIVPRQGELYEYDATGNLTKAKTGNTFTYDAENMQVKYNGGASQQNGADYVYDGSGKRVKKIVGTTQTIFVYNAAGQLTAEYQTNYQPGNTRTSYLTADHLGSPRVTTDSTGTVKSRHDYYAFGEEISAGITGRSSTQKYVDDNIRQQYTGYERDDESGLDYAQARYYSSQHGRFTSVDPLMASATIKNPQTFNRYSYALNSPYKFTDPLGLAACGTGSANGRICYQADDLEQQKDKVEVPEELIAAASLKTITVDNGTGTVTLSDEEVKQIKDYITNSYQAGFTEGKLLEQGAIDEITIKNSEARSTGEKESQTDGVSINKDGPTLKHESTDEKSKGNTGGKETTAKTNMEAIKTIDRNNGNLATERQNLITNLSKVTRTVTYDDKKVSTKLDFSQYVDLLARTAKIIGRVDGQQSIKKVQ